MTDFQQTGQKIGLFSYTFLRICESFCVRLTRERFPYIMKMNQSVFFSNIHFGRFIKDLMEKKGIGII